MFSVNYTVCDLSNSQNTRKVVKPWLCLKIYEQYVTWRANQNFMMCIILFMPRHISSVLKENFLHEVRYFPTILAAEPKTRDGCHGKLYPFITHFSADYDAT